MTLVISLAPIDLKGSITIRDPRTMTVGEIRALRTRLGSHDLETQLAALAEMLVSTTLLDVGDRAPAAWVNDLPWAALQYTSHQVNAAVVRAPDAKEARPWH